MFGTRKALPLAVALLLLPAAPPSVGQAQEPEPRARPATSGQAEAFTRREDVIYGRKYGTALTMDVFTPKKSLNGAAVVLVVSGGWVSDNQSINSALFAIFLGELVNRGYTVFAVVHGSQPLVSTSRFALVTNQNDATVSTYGIDPSDGSLLAAGTASTEAMPVGVAVRCRVMSIDRGRGATEPSHANGGGFASTSPGRTGYATARAHPPSPQFPTRPAHRDSSRPASSRASRNRQPVARAVRANRVMSARPNPIPRKDDSTGVSLTTRLAPLDGEPPT